jgi:hypothetical protein
MEIMRSLESVKEINEKVMQNIDDEVRFTYFVETESGFDRKVETEISRLEAAAHLEEMRDRIFLVKHKFDGDFRYLKNEQMHLNSFILLAEEGEIIRLYNMVKADFKNGCTKYAIQYKLHDYVLTFEIIEQTSSRHVRATKQERVAV